MFLFWFVLIILTEFDVVMVDLLNFLIPKNQNVDYLILLLNIF